MSEKPLSDAERDELQHISERWHVRGTQPPLNGYTRNRRMAHKLVRAGYLYRRQLSEQIRGEPRCYYWVFYLTDKGRAAL